MVSSNGGGGALETCAGPRSALALLFMVTAAVPTGDTEFEFRAAGLNFQSVSYQWLVISGARAQYKGTGTINGTGNFGFLLTAFDGQVNGAGGTDKFRIKIWDVSHGDALVYDNQVVCGDTADNADPCTTLAGGSIVIHR